LNTQLQTSQPINQAKNGYSAIDWNALTVAQAFIELCNRIGVKLRVDPEGKLKATGYTKESQPYIADIVTRCRGSVIAHLLNLPLPDISAEEENANFRLNAQALDVTITEYCAAVGHTTEHREKLLSLRRHMAPIYIMQNLCAFRAWLYETNQKG